MSNLKHHKKSQLAKACLVKLELINHTVGFVCLTVMSTKTRSALESNPILSRGTEFRVF